MSATKVMQAATVDNLLDAVAQLDEQAFAVFETGFEQIWLQRSGLVEHAAVQIVEQHRLPLPQQTRVRDLLWKNREEGLTPAEEEELDGYMAQMDQALEKTAEELLKLAASRQPHQPNGQS